MPTNAKGNTISENKKTVSRLSLSTKFIRLINNVPLYLWMISVKW